MKDKLSKLIDLKSIVTILITIALLYGWVTKMISTEVFMPIVVMIYTFYFAKKDTADAIITETTTTETTNRR